MSIEKRFDIPFISALALREKQIQQNYRPIIAVHKWFARRPGTLFRGLLLAEFSDRPLREAFYTSNDLKGIAIADPFMGGGTPLIEANRIGCDVTGYDINPMAYWIVNREIEYLDLQGLSKIGGKACPRSGEGDRSLLPHPVPGMRLPGGPRQVFPLGEAADLPPLRP